MRAPAVRKLLNELGLPEIMNPYGFRLSADYRLECAGGIAGRTEMWRIVRIKFTDANGENLRVESDWHRYKKTLKPELLKWKNLERLRAEGKSHER